MEKAHKAAIEGLKKYIAEIEVQLKQIVHEYEGIRKNYALLRSVPGVGYLTACISFVAPIILLQK